MNKMQIKIKKGAIFGMDARIAILVVAILGAFTYPVVSSFISKSRAEAILATTRSVSTAIENYIIDVDSIPNSIDNLYSTLPTKTDQANKWSGPYLKGESSQRFVPTLVWTLMDDDCTVTTKDSRYCTYRVSYVYHDFSNAVYQNLIDYYAGKDFQISYDDATNAITINYGYAVSGTYNTYASFKVKETP